MQDRLGRKIHYLRISVTDRCNLRCTYCMPQEGVEWIAHERLLSYEQIVRLVRLFARLGVDKVRLTGGEPLVRKGVADLIRNIREVEGIKKITLTTNGILLKEQLPALLEAGISGLNLSLDTLDREQFIQITRRDELNRVLEGLEAALLAPELTVKVNCVPQGINDEQLVLLAALAKDRKFAVRFIEMMPIGLGSGFAYRSEKEVLNRLEKAFGPAKPIPSEEGGGPGRYFSFRGFTGKVGFISAMSHKFCEDCNRIRLTSTGFLKTCLQYSEGVDLKALMDNGESDERLLSAMEKAIFNKPACHQFSLDKEENIQGPNMNQIGG
ncbi:MAG: GTP 3',8-cyclase MoaA [Lachnospiraceae bacterium]